MPLLIGMDEAGYGPNLGPLVVTAVAWEVPGDPRRTDLWKAFDGVVSREPADAGGWVQVADSKQVYSPARGLQALETGVLAALGVLQRCKGAAGAVRLAGASTSRGAEARTNGDAEPRAADACIQPTHLPASLAELRRWVSPQTSCNEDSPEPWHRDFDLPLPQTECCQKTLDRLQSSWHTRCAAQGVRLRGVLADVVPPSRFNAETRRLDSKGRALSELSMRVLSKLLGDSAGEEHVLIVADKHGGRNRYHEFLPLVFGDRFVCCREEGLECSRYQVGSAEIRFETKAERHLPVALASMVSKYLRELSMVLFNRFWTSRLPGLKPTAGYPNDAVRFRAEIAALQRELGIADDVLWRER